MFKNDPFKSTTIFTLIFLSLIAPATLTYTYPRELKIGLLTHGGLENVELAFRYAVDVINENRTILSQTMLVPEIRSMGSAEDSPSTIIRNVLELVNEKVAAVVGPFRSSHAQIASYMLSELHIPMITPTSTDPFLRNPLWSDYLLHMQPLDEYQSMALLDLVKHMGWNSVALISSMDSYGINGLTTFQKLSNERKIKIAANEMIPLTKDIETLDVSKQMLNLKNSEARIFIMNVHSGYARVILKTAKQMGLIGSQYAWVVTDGTVKDASKLLNDTSERFDDYVQGMIGYMSSICCSRIRDQFIKNWHTDAEGVDGDGSWAASGLIGSSTGKMELKSRASLTYDSVWIIAAALDQLMYTDHLPLKVPEMDFWSTPVRNYNNGQTILNYIKNVDDFEGLTGKVKFDDEGGPVKKTYDLVNFRNKEVVKVGEWKPNIGLQMNESETIVWYGQTETKPTSAVSSLSGTHLRLGITHEPPFIGIDFNCTNKNRLDKSCYTGLCIELVELLAQHLHFEYEFVISEDRKFGSQNADGSWNGLIKMLLEGTIDVGAVNFAMNKARESAIDFSMPFINTGLVMTTKIKQSKSDPFFWTKPFDIDLWYAILSFAVLMVLLIWLYDHMSPSGFYGRRMHAALRCTCKACEGFRSHSDPNLEDEEDECLFETRLSDPSENNEELMSVGNSMWMIVACLFSIGPVEGVPRNPSGRIILAMWWFMVLIVTAMYTANLAAFLTVTRMDSGINSISQLIAQDKVKWGTVNGTNAQILLEAAKSPELEEVYKKMDPVKSLQEGFDRARNDEYVFFYGGAIVTFENNKKPCNLQIIGEQLFSFGYAFGFPPQSPYLETFNAAMLTLSERNDLDTLWKEHSKGECLAKTTTKSSSLNLANIYGLCYTFFAVIAVSAVVLFGEILYESIMDMKRFKTSFIDAIKYRFVYIWKRPNYEKLHYSEHSIKKSEEDDREKEIMHTVEYDGKHSIRTLEYDGKTKSTKSDDTSLNQYNISSIPLSMDKENKSSKGSKGKVNGMYPVKPFSLEHQPRFQDERLHQPRFQDERLKPPYKLKHSLSAANSDISYMPSKPHPYHMSLPLNYSPAESDNSKTSATKHRSMPRSNHKHRYKYPNYGAKSPNGENMEGFEDLFDRTLERMTNKSDNRSSARSSKAKLTAPNHIGASLSTSPIYSSPGDSDTDEPKSESDGSPQT